MVTLPFFFLEGGGRGGRRGWNVDALQLLTSKHFCEVVKSESRPVFLHVICILRHKVTFSMLKKTNNNNKTASQ